MISRKKIVNPAAFKAQLKGIRNFEVFQPIDELPLDYIHYQEEGTENNFLRAVIYWEDYPDTGQTVYSLGPISFLWNRVAVEVQYEEKMPGNLVGIGDLHDLISGKDKFLRVQFPDQDLPTCIKSDRINFTGIRLAAWPFDLDKLKRTIL